MEISFNSFPCITVYSKLDTKRSISFQKLVKTSKQYFLNLQKVCSLLALKKALLSSHCKQESIAEKSLVMNASKFLISSIRLLPTLARFLLSLIPTNCIDFFNQNKMWNGVKMQKAKDQLIHTATLQMIVDYLLWALQKGINSLEIIKHSESKTQTKACVVRQGSRAYAITMDFEMFLLGLIKGLRFTWNFEQSVHL